MPQTGFLSAGGQAGDVAVGEGRLLGLSGFGYGCLHGRADGGGKEGMDVRSLF